MRNPLVVGPRVYLRALEAADAETNAAQSNAETETFMYRGRAPASPISFARWVEDDGKHALPSSIHLAVCLRDGDHYIGSVTLHQVDYLNRTAETGSGLADGFRGQGLGTEAKMLLLEYAFERLHLHAINSHVFEQNSRSAAALKKQGYRPAGRRKWDDVKGGVYCDGLLFDLLRDEWLAAREAWRATLPAEE